MKRILIFLFIFTLAIKSSFAQLPISKNFQVALILPFHLDKPWGNNKTRSDIMLDYYQGMYIALKKYESKGLEMQLYVFDNANSKTTTEELLLDPKMKNMDLIIGPTLIENLHIMNEFSSKNQVAFFSPFTAADSLFPNNPLFFNAAPTKSTKAHKFIEYYKNNHQGKEILFLLNGEHYLNSYGPELFDLVKSEKLPYNTANIEQLKYIDSLKIFDPNRSYVIFHAGEDKNELIKIEKYLKKTTASIQIIGDYSNFYLRKIGSSFCTKYNVSVISSEFIDTQDSAVFMENFRSNYKEKYKDNPGKWAIVGHDQASFICDMLLKYGRFRANDFIGESYQYYNSRYMFKKDMHCNQNKSLFIIKKRNDIIVSAE